jgi:hypothetical protein
MPRVYFASRILLSSAITAICLTPAQAQSSLATAPKAGAEAQTTAQSQAATKANDEILAKGAKLYYSTAKDGLAGFDCSVRPDWLKVFVSSGNGEATAGADPRVALLNTVKVTLHARLNGSTTVDWSPPANPAKPLDQEMTAMLDTMHQGLEQMLQGFMQFWTPFVDGSAFPENSQGVEMTRTADGFTMHAVTSDTSVTEAMNADLVIHQFNVRTKESEVAFSPSYKSTAGGLLVNGFEVNILPAGAAPEKAQKMHVEIEYQTVDGSPIPAKLSLHALDSAIVDFTLDGCTVARNAK